MARIVFGDVTGGVQIDNLDVSALLDYDHFSQNAKSLQACTTRHHWLALRLISMFRGEGLDTAVIAQKLRDRTRV